MRTEKDGVKGSKNCVVLKVRTFYPVKLEEKWQVWVIARDIFGGRIFKELIADIFKVLRFVCSNGRDMN